MNIRKRKSDFCMILKQENNLLHANYPKIEFHHLVYTSIGISTYQMKYYYLELSSSSVFLIWDGIDDYSDKLGRTVVFHALSVNSTYGNCWVPITFKLWLFTELTSYQDPHTYLFSHNPQRPTWVLRRSTGSCDGRSSP